MTEFTGSARLRRAIENQASAGEASFTLPIGEAAAICDECEDELAALSWADSVPAPVDADGEVVPLTTEVMYTDGGQKIELGEFYLLYSVLRDGFVWRAIRHIDGDIEDWKLDCLHLRRPDSWERLEEDILKAENNGTCGYFDRVINARSCDDCPVNGVNIPCAASALRDALLRAKALAGRDAKEAR